MNVAYLDITCLDSYCVRYYSSIAYPIYDKNSVLKSIIYSTATSQFWPKIKQVAPVHSKSLEIKIISRIIEPFIFINK